MKTHVSVAFPGSQMTYCYFTDTSLKEGDHVVVDSTNSLGLAIVQTVPETDPDRTKWASRWVLCKVDVEAHRKRIRKENS